MVKNQISYKQELIRKSIHLCSLSIPGVYYITNFEIALFYVLPVFIIVLLIDLLSKKGMPLHNLVYKYFGAMFREHEKREGWMLNGASWVLIAALLTILIFPKILAVTSFTILIISDLSAALVGRRYGKHPLFDKSWEGTFTFFITSSLIVVFFWALEGHGNYFLYFGILASALTAFAESASSVLKLDDNLAVPAVFSLTMWLLHPIAVSAGFPYIF